MELETKLRESDALVGWLGWVSKIVVRYAGGVMHCVVYFCIFAFLHFCILICCLCCFVISCFVLCCALMCFGAVRA